MTRSRLVALCLMCCCAASAGNRRQDIGAAFKPDTIASIEAPFPMPQLKRPDFGTKETRVRLPARGTATAAIQRAIDRTAKAGGGRVTLPAGTWHTGRIELKSGVELHLEAGCTLVFSGRIADYLPTVFTRDEGVEIYSLGACIYANGAHDIGLTGKGKIVGPSTDCEIYRRNRQSLDIEAAAGSKPLAERVFDGDRGEGYVFLPKTFAPIHCTGVLVEDVTLEQGLYWNVVPQYCDSVILRGIVVSSYGHGRTDGIDLDSSSNVLVEYCTLDCQDDCFTLKSGRGGDGVRVGRQTENVVVRYCIAKRGAGGFVLGTETAGGIRNAFCHDCLFDGTDQAVRLKSRRTRGGDVGGIWAEHITARGVKTGFFIDMLGEARWMGELARRHPGREALDRADLHIPSIRGVYLNDVDIERGRTMIDVRGLPESKAKDLFWGNSTVDCRSVGGIRDAEEVFLKDLDIRSADTALVVDGCDIVSLFEVNKAVCAQGDPSQRVLKHEPMRDTAGKPIQAHAFQIKKYGDTYYWYGENKADCLPGSNRTMGGVRLYTSTDFLHWQDEGLMMTPDTTDYLSPVHYSQKLERPHILHCRSTGKWVMWLKAQDTDGYFVTMEADSLKGPYHYAGSLRPQGFGVGDFDMWADEESGKAYVWFERPHYELVCCTLSDDYLGVGDEYSVHFTGLVPPHTREAPAHFIKDGVHYLFTSGTSGYTPNPTLVHRFTDPHGRYETLGDAHPDDVWQHSFCSQVCCVIERDGVWYALADVWQPVIRDTDYARRTAKSYEARFIGHKPSPQNYAPVQVRNRRYEYRIGMNAVYDATYLMLPIDFSDAACPVIRRPDPAE